MKIEEAKNIVAVKHGYASWRELISAYDLGLFTREQLELRENEAALLHTKHHVEQALKAAYSNSKINIRSYVDDTSYNANEYSTQLDEVTIDSDSILNAYSIENIQ